MFIASTYWRGSLCISDLRKFDTEDECWDYLEGIHKEKCDNNARECPNDTERYRPRWVSSFHKVYEVFPNKKPRLCKYTRNTFDKD